MPLQSRPEPLNALLAAGIPVCVPVNPAKGVAPSLTGHQIQPWVVSLGLSACFPGCASACFFTDRGADSRLVTGASSDWQSPDPTPTLPATLPSSLHFSQISKGWHVKGLGTRLCFPGGGWLGGNGPMSAHNGLRVSALLVDTSGCPGP